MAKRVGNIYLPNCNYTCLYNAYRKAAKGKRYRGDVLQFTDNLEGNLLALLDDLKNHTYTVGAYREFYVYEPKKRLIMGMMKHNDCYRFKMQLLEDVETIINESGIAA